MSHQLTPRTLLRKKRIAAGIALFGILLVLATAIAARIFLSSAATRAAVEAYVTELKEKRDLAQAAIAASRITDPLGSVAIENSGEIERRLGLLHAASAANRAALEMGDRWPSDLTERLQNAGASSWEINRWQKRFRKQYDWDHSRPVYVSRQRVVDLQIGMLKFLGDHREGWGVPDAKTGVHFFDRGSRRDFDALLQEYASALLAEQDAVARSIPGK